MNLPDISKDSATAQPPNPREPSNVDHVFHPNGMDKTVVLKNLEGEECRDLDNL